jgi:hypothetical protein
VWFLFSDRPPAFSFQAIRRAEFASLLPVSAGLTTPLANQLPTSCHSLFEGDFRWPQRRKRQLLGDARRHDQVFCLITGNRRDFVVGYNKTSACGLGIIKA